MEFEHPQNELFFNIAQTFFLDKAFFKGADEIGITKVNLYFKCKPLKTGNKSGIDSPGVTMYLCATKDGDIPDISKVVKQGIARKEYEEIVASLDATIPTTFNFPEPIEVNTGFSYALIIAFDGDEYFTLWKSKEGEVLVGTNNKTAGPAGQYIGKYYEYSSVASVNNIANLADRLTALNDTDLKFDVYCARYSANYSNTTVSNTVTGQTEIIQTAQISHSLPSKQYEFFVYSATSSGNLTNLNSGYVFQNTVQQPGTVAINANSVVVNCSPGTNFNTLYDLSSDYDQFLVVKVNDPDETYMVRKIVSIESNTSMIIDRPSRWTNSAANFLRTPVAQYVQKDETRSFGKRQNFLILNNSNANSSLRFTNNTVETVTINSGGSGYANGDVLTITAVTSNSMNAVANVSTNSTGGITSLTFSNNGCGINSAPSYSIANSTGGATSGTGANLSFGIGATLLMERANTKFANAILINYDFHGHRWAGKVGLNKGTSHTITHKWKYYSTGNTYDINVHANANEKLVKKLKKNNLPVKNSPLMISWSYRVLQGNTANTDQSDSVIDIIIDSNSVFSCPKVEDPDLYIYKNIINNDYTNEHTRYGNALSKHISKKINFQEGRFAEDIVVYLKANRPANTDIKVYTKIHNSNDPESFDDKDWTLLRCTDGANSYTSETNENDFVELTYGFYSYPNSQFTSNGTVSTVLNQANVAGANTTFTTDFANNDLIKLYSPLFPDNYMIAVVDNVTNNTLLTLKSNVSNNGLVGSGLKLDKIQYKNQAFNNILRDNVVRYYSTSMAEYDTYDTFAIKLVLLSSNPSVVPRIDDVKAIGVSS